MNQSASLILPILFLAFLCEGLVEYVARPFLVPNPGDEVPSRAGAATKHGWALPPDLGALLLRYVAAAVGIGLALAYQVDLLALAGLSSGWPWVGQIITGILIGRGSNYINDLSDRWLASRG